MFPLSLDLLLLLLVFSTSGFFLEFGFGDVDLHPNIKYHVLFCVYKTEQISNVLHYSH